MDNQNNNISPSITLGSLFDGIGGFPYAASFYGIKTLWGSEIMPHAISVTKRHLPDMEHVGDITMLDGAKLQPVDIITFGSPCQGLSMAGRRLGLADERSGLFSEAIRIIEEMREDTNGKYPRYALWENVPGAMSSNFGLDFKAVLEAFTKTEIPMPQSGKWANSGMVRSNRVDLAWVMYNAQHFGVPQRRRRIFLICDFNGRSAGEILFKPKSLSRYFEKSRKAGQNFANYATRSINNTGISAEIEAPEGAEREVILCSATGQSNSEILENLSATLNCSHERPIICKQNSAITQSTDCLNPWDTQQSRVFTEDGLSPTLAGADGGGGRNPAGLIMQGTTVLNDQGGDSFSIEKSDISPTLRSETHGNLPIVTVPEIMEIPQNNVVGIHVSYEGEIKTAPTAYSLTGNSNASGQNAPLVAHDKALGITAKGNGDCFVMPECHYTLTYGGGQAGQGYPAALVREVHPQVVGTLTASASGLNRPGGMGSETDLYVVIPDGDYDSAPDKSQQPIITYCLQGNMIGRQDHNGPKGNGINEELAFTLTATDVSGVTVPTNDISPNNSEIYECPTYQDVVGALCHGDHKGVGNQYVSQSKCIVTKYLVRRLIPTECERLQGYPDGWTEFGHDGKEISDTRRYQMLGNSVAVPCVAYIMQGIAEQFNKTGEEKNKTNAGCI